MVQPISDTEKSDILFIPVQQLLGKAFAVKDYQRGYKWDKKEILELLDDLNEHDTSTGKYCLQPIILRDGGKEIELIDGQQRITSIYLILVYLTGTMNGTYSISYETREESKEFLSGKIPEILKYVEAKMPWEKFIELIEYKKYDNVDVYHFYTVFTEIVLWFSAHDNIGFKNLFLRKLLHEVYFIWYNIDASKNGSNANTEAETIFLNLNAGKIPLTASELIKALFILDTLRKNSKEIAKLKSTELALEWDQIENKLHDDSFWYFICDDERYNSLATRIDYLIDIVNRRNIKKEDDFFSYRIYEDRFKTSKDLDWLEIKNTYNKLAEWYDSKEIYHYVGFLVVSNIKSLNEILDLSIGISKAKFKDELINFIKVEFARTKKDESNNTYFIYSPDNLDYVNSRKQCEAILLLLNVLQYIKNVSDNKFPFELYKKETWSVEHINPQNPRQLENISVIKNWVLTNKSYYLKSLGDNKLIIAELEAVESYFENINDGDTRQLTDLKLPKNKIETFEKLQETLTLDLSLHGISNLALLDKNSNSKLSNRIFLEKRKLILEFDQNGKYISKDGKEKKVFIPICTKNVFSKIYTVDKDSLVDSFFGKVDMDAYYRFINNELTPFFN